MAQLIAGTDKTREELERMSEEAIESNDPKHEYWTRYSPNPVHPCYDCGSYIPQHHTALCDLTGEGDIKDLPHVGDAGFPPQAWVGSRHQTAVKQMEPTPMTDHPEHIVPAMYAPEPSTKVARARLAKAKAEGLWWCTKSESRAGIDHAKHCYSPRG